MNHIIYNNKLVEESSFLVPISNRALLYGDSLFETVRIMNGRPCFLSMHLDRLKKGMDILKMKPNWHDLSSKVFSIIDKNKINKGATLKIVVYRNEGGKYTPESNKSSYFMHIEEAPNFYGLNSKGWKIDFFKDHLKPFNAFSSFKSSNCFNYILAAIWGKELKIDQAIILNQEGRISEGYNSNIFAVISNKLYTPPIEEGCINGVMRRIIILTAKKRGMVTIEQPMEKELLLESDEIFLSNVNFGIRWVGALHQKRYMNKTSKLLLNDINNEIKLKSSL